MRKVSGHQFQLQLHNIGVVDAAWLDMFTCVERRRERCDCEEKDGAQLWRDGCESSQTEYRSKVFRLETAFPQYQRYFRGKEVSRQVMESDEVDTDVGAGDGISARRTTRHVRVSSLDVRELFPALARGA